MVSQPFHLKVVIVLSFSQHLVPSQWCLDCWSPFWREQLPCRDSRKHSCWAGWSLSLRMTPVVSRFNLLIEAVTTSTYHFSSIWLGRVIGLVMLTPDTVAEGAWGAASIKLASCPIGQSSIWGLVEGTVVCLLLKRDPYDGGVLTHASVLQHYLNLHFWCWFRWFGATGSYFLG